MLTVFLAPTVVAALAGVVCLVLVMRGGDRAVAVVRRYPLALVTWLIAGPFAAAAAFGILVLSQYDDGTTSDDVSFLLVLGLLAVLCVAVIVWGHIIGRGRGRRPWLLIAIASPGIVAVLYVMVLTVTATQVLWSLGLLVVAAGSIANGILAVRVHAARIATTAERQAPIDAA
ncbi:hypothetical protein [Demequina sp. NBRC 110051]|uniref:hypothetical protein n=1 Tax=Demequina sp. NBRC 110051 TaxID=1570340 RepID=UPI0009FEB3FD|nr:hypothetical protein [Demequina sp. NBRC 110051]